MKTIKRILAAILIVTAFSSLLSCYSFAATTSLSSTSVSFYGYQTGHYYSAIYSDSYNHVGSECNNNYYPTKMIQAYCYKDGRLWNLSDIDGSCGSGTINAITAYQAIHSVSSDSYGKAKENTWRDMAWYHYGTTIAQYL